jgi:hypothetical protein
MSCGVVSWHAICDTCCDTSVLRAGDLDRIALVILTALQRVGPHAAYQLVASGAIKSVRIGQKGGGIRITRRTLRAFLDGQQEAK